MWHDYRPPIHIYAVCQGFEALVNLRTGEVLQRALPRKVASIVKEWCLNHQAKITKLNGSTIGTKPSVLSR